MFVNSNIDKECFVQLMTNLKRENQEMKLIQTSREYHMGILLKDIKKSIKSVSGWKKLFKIIDGKIRWKKVLRKYHNKVNITDSHNNIKNLNYFSIEKFVVYTSVFGNYDTPQEPVFIPDNCEFVFIGDIDLPSNTCWKRYNISKIEKYLEGLSNAEKNRFCKMFPHLLFPKTNISIYIDGNIKVVTDLTELINMDRSLGISLHRHKSRKCVYQEIDACKMIKKAPADVLDNFAAFLKNEGFPADYGMAECNVIIRDHDNSQVHELMDEWWYYFKNCVKRDQLSLPYLLWKRNIAMEKVTTLGDNVAANYAIRVVQHI